MKKNTRKALSILAGAGLSLACASSAWSQDGPNTVRLALSGDRLAGALVVGEQALADPLRFFIEQQIDIRPLRPYLERGGPEMTWMLQQLYLRLRPAATGASGGGSRSGGGEA